MTTLLKNYTLFCQKNNIVIKPHQVYGVLWCIRRELSTSLPLALAKEEEETKEEDQTKKRGGVLADEMGMGKTIQMIGVFLLNPQRKTLLIVPPILIPQWVSEIKKFTGHISTTYYGKDRKKIDLLDSKAMIVITSYETVSRDFNSGVFQEVSWDRIVCDEAHHIRNPNTHIYQKIYALIYSQPKNPILWFITGTPMHHSSRDLYALYFLLGYSAAEFTPENIRSRFLQRHHDASALLEKRENTIMVEWTESRERDLAKDIHRSIPFLGFSELDEDRSSFWGKKGHRILVSMLRAKQTCILSKMTEASYLSIRDQGEKDLGETEEMTIDVEDLPFLEKTMPVFDESTTTKLREILSILRARRENGNGKVVFCHYKLEMKYLLMNLSSDLPKSASWVGTWKDYKKIKDLSDLGESPILVLQIRSGCEGLNLQDRFSEIYFVSPNWNPTLEDQAVARCYRIGQKKSVQVFRFAMNFVDSPERNLKRKAEVQQYHSIYENLPFDLQQYVSSFLPEDSREGIRNYSMDQYMSSYSEKKKKHIQEFLDTITCKT